MYVWNFAACNGYFASASSGARANEGVKDGICLIYPLSWKLFDIGACPFFLSKILCS